MPIHIQKCRYWKHNSTHALHCQGSVLMAVPNSGYSNNVNPKDWPRGYKTFYMLILTDHAIQHAHKFWNVNNNVGILTFISMINPKSKILDASNTLLFSILVLMTSENFMLSWVEYAKATHFMEVSPVGNVLCKYSKVIAFWSDHGYKTFCAELNWAQNFNCP